MTMLNFIFTPPQCLLNIQEMDAIHFHIYMNRAIEKNFTLDSQAPEKLKENAVSFLAHPLASNHNQCKQNQTKPIDVK